MIIDRDTLECLISWAENDVAEGQAISRHSHWHNDLFLNDSRAALKWLTRIQRRINSATKGEGE